MAITYTPIATSTATGSTSSLTFSSIPSTYTDLVLIIAGSDTSIGSNTLAQFNSDTGTNYSQTRLYGDGTSAASDRVSNDVKIIVGRLAASGGVANGIAHIMNYSNTTTYKTSISRSNNAASISAAVVGLWRSVSAITSIYLYTSNGSNFTSGSTFTLYGIKSA